MDDRLRFKLANSNMKQFLQRYGDSPKQSILKLLMNTLEYCLTFCFGDNDSINIPATVGDAVGDELVHWCHGAPGWILVFIHPFFQNYSFSLPTQTSPKCLTGLEIAKKMGNCVWKKGLLKKGLSLCHGIGGNGLALKSLYNVTRDEIWLKRAYCFADFGIDNFNILKNVPDNPICARQSNYPNSLFEGIAGFGLFLSTFGDPSIHETLKCFPL